MFNSVAIIGNLGADPDIRYAASGTAIANIRLAVNDHRKDQQGNTIQQTYWFTAVAFGKVAEVIGNYCQKGSKVGIQGKLVQREWEDQSGQKRSTVEIRIDSLELLGSKNGDSQGQHQGQQGYQQAPPPPPPPPQQQRQGQPNRQPPPPSQGGYNQQGAWNGPPPEDDMIPF